MLRAELTDGGKGEGGGRQHLIEAYAVVVQILLLHQGAEGRRQGHHVRILRHRLVHGEQSVVGHGFLPVWLPLHGEDAQVGGVLPAGHNQGVPHAQGLVQGGVGVAGEDHVDAVHPPGQLVVLALSPAVGAAVGQADDKIGSVPGQQLFLQGGHGALRRVGGGLELHARHGGVAVRLLPHQAENAVVDAAPLQNQVVPDAVAVPRRPGVRVLRRGLVVGLDNGGHRIAAVHGGVEHLRQAAGAVVKLMVAQRRGVVPHRAQGPQLRGLRGVDGLEQTAHGKVSGVQNQGVRVGRPLLLDQGGQAGIAAVFPALLIRHGEEVVVGVMGEQNRRFISGRVSRGQSGQRPGQQTGRQAQPKRAYANRMMHLIPSSAPSLPHFSEKGKPQPGL